MIALRTLPSVLLLSLDVVGAARADDAAPTPVSDAPPTDAPPTDTPPTDAPVSDAPVSDTPVTDAPVSDTPMTDAPSTDAPTTDAPTTDAPATEQPGFSLETHVVPWITVAAGVVAIGGALALLGFGGATWFAVLSGEGKLAALEDEGYSDENLRKAQVLQAGLDVRRKDWQQYGAPMVAGGLALLVAGGVFIAGGAYTGMASLEGAE